MSSQPIHLLSGDDLLEALTMKDTIEIMRDAFISLSNGEAQVPQRLNLSLNEDGAEALFMPVHIPSTRRVGIKVVTIAPKNLEKNLPLIHAMVMVFDQETGRPLALMNGENLTALRTGAGSGLATDLLARKDAHTVTLFGTGGQARYQLRAMAEVRDLRRVWVIARNPERTAAFCEEMSEELQRPVLPAPSRDVLKQSQIICTATTSRTPLFEHQEIARGTHINGIGSYRPDMAEVPPETVAEALVVMDQRSACLKEAGDLTQAVADGFISEDQLQLELGTLAIGDHPGREHADQITFFKSVGNAVQDLATANLAYQRSLERDLGQSFQL